MFRKLLFVFVTFIFAIACFGQHPGTGSKKDALRALKNNMPDSDRQYIYNFLGTVYLINTRFDKKIIDSCFYYLRKAVYLGDSANSNNKEITNESLCLLAQTYLYAGDPITAKRIYLQVINNYQLHSDKTNEARTWRRFGKEFMYRYTDLLYVPGYFDRAISLFDQEKNIAEKAEVMFDKMNFFSGTDDTSAAEEQLQKIIAQAKANHFEDLSQIYCMLARQNRYKGNLNKGLGYALDAIKYIDYAKNKKEVHNFYGELAQIYEELGETEKSIIWYKKCIAEREHNGTQLYVFYRTVSLMVIQMLKSQREKEAIALLLRLSVSKPPVTHAEKASLAQSLAYCYAATKQYDKAEPQFLEMIREYNEGEFNSELLYIAYSDVAKFYIDTDQYGKAGPYLEKATEFGGVIVSQKKELNFLMFKVDSANGNFVSAIRHLQTYKTLNDSIFNAAKSRQINELMIQYESEKKDNNINILEKEKILQRGRLAQANQTRNWILGVAILLFIITGLLFNNSRIRKQTHKKLQVQQKEIKVKNIALQQLVKEKDWLVKEIHHRVKNNLHTIIGLLHTQSGFLKTGEALLAISESQHRIQAMSIIHEKLFQSADLSKIEMPGYIHELVNYLKHSFGTGQRILFKIETEQLELKLSHALPLGLILNEAITNSIKYAFPGNKDGIITVSLKHISGQQYLLSISDNGIGLPPAFDIKKSNSMGMGLMVGLSEDMQGSFSVINNQGTEIKIIFLYDSFPADDMMIQEDTVKKKI